MTLTSAELEMQSQLLDIANAIAGLNACVQTLSAARMDHVQRDDILDRLDRIATSMRGVIASAEAVIAADFPA